MMNNRDQIDEANEPLLNNNNGRMYSQWDENKPAFILKNQRIVGLKLALLCVFVVLIAFAIGLITGSFTKPIRPGTSQDSYYSSLIQDDRNNAYARDKLFKEINAEYIKAHLKFFTSFAHRAGTPGGKLASDYIYDQWKKQGMDDVREIDYDVLLDVPDQSKLNSIQIYDSEKKLEKTIEIKETQYDKELNYTDLSKPFLAYSKNGSVESSELYFVNNCDLKDFLNLVDNGFNLTDKIVICKYGGLFRGNKVKFAEKFGVKGVLLYDDPQRSAPINSSDKRYPDGWLLPGDGTQRGCIYTKDGDPLTPMFPSKSYMHRIKESEQEGLPTIIAQVIGYDLAADLFSLMQPDTSSKQIPAEWKGELNVTYTYGGRLRQNRTLAINVFNERKIEKIYNVIGIVKGSVEPDRYVIVGNHKDSWVFGSMDPNSGTSVLLEISRSLLELKKNGVWTPKRSVVFLAWDAEEYGLLGSTELVEEFKAKLSANAVMYINCDTAIQGTFALSAKASPLLHSFLYDVARSVKLANSSETVFDRWLKNEPDLKQDSMPWINPNLGSSSDHTAFTQRAGLPCMDIRLVRDNSNPVYKLVKGSYPLYHSSYETFRLVNDFIDPDFKASVTIAQVMGEIVRAASGSLILPFNSTRYAEILTSEFVEFEKKHSKELNDLGLSLNHVKIAIDKFSVAARDFHARLNSIDRTKYHMIRVVNEQMRNIERAFLDDTNLRRTGHAHTIFAPSQINKYIGNTFPFVVNALLDYKEAEMRQNETWRVEALEKLKLNLSILTYSIQGASSIIREPFDFDI